MSSSALARAETPRRRDLRRDRSCPRAAAAASVFAGCLILVSTALTTPAAAQGPNPPPRQDTLSPTGVSLATGAFNHDERDLAIGGGAFPAGLTLDRSYLSNLSWTFSGYSGYPTQGWNSNLNIRVGNSIVPTPWLQPPTGMENFLYSVSVGNRSVGFTGGSTYPTGGFVGTYEPVQLGGEILEFGGGNDSTGHFVFTDEDGTVMLFNPQSAAVGAMAVASITAPDGTRADFTYDGSGLRSVISNRGWALLFEYGPVPGGTARIRACAVNMATTYVTALSACPAGAQTVTYQYGAGSVMPMLTGFTDAAGKTTSYGYVARDHLGCITLPGQTGCQISNSYSLCVPPPIDPDNPEPPPPSEMTTHEQVLSQTTATGETYSYNFLPERECPTNSNPDPVAMTVGTATTTLRLNTENMPGSITDPIGRTTQYGYVGRMNWSALGGAPATLALITRPEGNRVQYDHDLRGNIREERLVAKQASGEADIVRTASYPETCANPRTCNRPDFVIDARSNRTDFTYDPTHGGVLSETGPADPNGIRPQLRYAYQQRYAWIRNSSGGYSRAATPVWVRVSESRCRTSAATGDPSSPCAVAGDEVVTTYDYGPDSGPNNLLLRGQVASGGGLSARTCYGYDAEGNRISETGPGAQLAACP